MRTLLAWLAHLYTALGLVCAAGIVVLIVRGDDHSFCWAFGLMMIATAIDATDGWLARAAKVHDVLPWFDGSALDNLIDFQTYTSLPLFLMWRAELLGTGAGWLLLLPLLASAYGFSQVNAKTDDGFFLGFPSYWNIIAFYLYALHGPPWAAITVVVAFSILTFVPTRYIYATRGGPFAAIINVGSAIWFLVLGFVLIGPAGLSQVVAAVSLLYPAAYLTLSVIASRRHRPVSGTATV